MRVQATVGKVLIVLSLAAVAFTFGLGQYMRSCGERYWSAVGDATPEQRNELFDQGLATPPSKVVNTTEPMYCISLALGMFGTLCVVNARKHC